MQEASTPATPAANGSGGGAVAGRRAVSRSAAGRMGGAARGTGWGYTRQNTREHSAFKEHLVSATKGFIRAIMLGKKKWSALVQQVGVGVGLWAVSWWGVAML